MNSNEFRRSNAPKQPAKVSVSSNKSFNLRTKKKNEKVFRIGTNNVDSEAAGWKAAVDVV